jgi:GT2 family glycosyltransferase
MAELIKKADPMSEPLVTAVILNTNRREDTLACLESLHRQSYPNLSIIVLDNASTDGSNEAVRAQYPRVQIIKLEQNLGYAGNNNVGIETAVQQGAQWVFVLNEDVILAEDAVSHLVSQAMEDPQVGMVGPMVYHYEHPEVIQSAGGVLTSNWLSQHAGQNEPDQGQYAQTRYVDWLSGCAILVRREAVEQSGMLDVRFFYYWEETEWCVRVRKDGWKILFVPGSKIWHKGVQVDYKPGPNVTYYWTRNWLLLLAKHHAPLRAWVYAFFWTTRNLLSWTLQPKWRSMREHRSAMWQGAMDFFRKRWGMRSVSNR